jgi:hypothetical protein
MAGSLFSSINSTNQINKQLNNTALFKESKQANLQDSNVEKIEGDIKRAQQGRKALSFLGASAQASSSQGLSNGAPATSILSTSSSGGLFGSAGGGTSTGGLFGGGSSGGASGGNLFSTLA